MSSSSGSPEPAMTFVDQPEATFSDEPTRVDTIVARFFSRQSGSTLALIGSTGVDLAVGADGKDDCAVLNISGPLSLVFGSDYVRGPKFLLYERGLLNNFDIGYYLIIANVSDIAAMGARPLAVTTVVRYPKTLSDQDFEALVAGIAEATRVCGTVNVGGDIGAAERIILSASAIGGCEPGTVLTRGGARAGDFLCLTGAVGTAGAAVAYFGDDSWSSKLASDLEDELLLAWKRPVARTVEGGILSTGRFATACQDVSDGLKATLEQLRAASGVGFVVDGDALPIARSTKAVAKLAGVDHVALAMSASVDFQLAFTVDPADLGACAQAFDQADRQMHVIGRATGGMELMLQGSTGDPVPLPGVAWRHQGGNIAKLAVGRTNP